MRLVPFLFLGTSALAQAQWLAVPTTNTPAATLGHRMAYDPASQRTFTLWGTMANGLAAGCSMWDGANWSACTTQVLGGAVFLGGRDVALCRDGTGALLMFGGWRPGFGIGGGTPMVLDGTWRIVANSTGLLQLSQLTPATRPSPRQGASMVRTSQGVLLFGGSAVNGFPQYGDSWEWNGTTWTQLAPANAPPARTTAAMAFDEARQVVVLFGGIGPGIVFDDTWEFDGSNWLLRTPAVSPPARSRAAFAWSPPLGRCVLFGGAPASGAELGDTWTWNGATWERAIALATPSARQGATLDFDAAHQQLLLVGGVAQSNHLADTHQLAWTAGPSSFTAFGSGCVGPTLQTPTLAAGPGELPRLGTTSQLTIGDLPAGTLTVPVFVFGSSTTFEASGGHALPFDLGFLGWPGCQQLVAHDVMLPSPTLASSVTFPLTVPIAANLVGYTLHVQGFVLYAPTGAAVSNALTAVVGT